MRDGSFRSRSESGASDHYTEEAIAWFETRTKERERTRSILDGMRNKARMVPERAVSLREELSGTEDGVERARIIEALSVQCEFCAEKHSTWECWNLCNFCGGFGHWHDSCGVLAVAELEGMVGVEKEREAGAG